MTKINPSIHIQNFDLTCESTAKLLGIDIDYQLNFYAHISTICRKASQQQNILKHLGSYLNRLNKLTIWSSCPFFIKFIKMTKATFVLFFYRSYQVLLTDVVIIPR
jgi:hypothetical protein